MIHIYCGDGKGKTTAALGLAVRAAGRGKRVLIARFLKNEDSGEVAVLREIPGVSVMPCEKCFGFTFRMNEAEKAEASAYYQELFEKTVRIAREIGADLLILDEILGACNTGMVDKAALEAFLKKKEPAAEVVLTGRNPWENVLELADYVTDMQAVKHPYQMGVGAREGIEY